MATALSQWNERQEKKKYRSLSVIRKSAYVSLKLIPISRIYTTRQGVTHTREPSPWIRQYLHYSLTIKTEYRIIQLRYSTRRSFPVS